MMFPLNATFAVSLLDPRASEPHGHVRESEHVTARSSHQQLLPGQPAQHQKGIRRWAAATQKPILGKAFGFVFPLTVQKSRSDCEKFDSLGLCTCCPFIFRLLPVPPHCMGMLTVLDLNALKPICIHSTYDWCFFCLFFFFPCSFTIPGYHAHAGQVWILWQVWQLSKAWRVSCWYVWCLTFYWHFADLIVVFWLTVYFVFTKLK